MTASPNATFADWRRPCHRYTPEQQRRRAILAALGSQPVTGPALARLAGCGLRTVYRDIAALRDEGARIGGATNFGYVLMGDR